MAKIKPLRHIRPVGYIVEYSYAGFAYRLKKITGVRWSATPLPGQPKAADKALHRCKAILSYCCEYGET